MRKAFGWLLIWALVIPAQGQLNILLLRGKRKLHTVASAQRYMSKRYYNAGGPDIVSSGRTYGTDSALTTFPGFGSGGRISTGQSGFSSAGISDPPPDSVFGTAAFHTSWFKETITGLRANGRYKVRIFTGFGLTNFSFSIDANSVSKGTMTVATPADDTTVVMGEFFCQADGSGNLELLFTSITTFALVNAIDIQEAGKIALGSGVDIGDFQANTGLTLDGTNVTNAGTPDTTGLTDPAPDNVYKAMRQVNSGNLNIVIPDIEDNNANYLLRLHFFQGTGVYATVKNGSTLWFSDTIDTSGDPVSGNALIFEGYGKSDGSHQINLQITDLGTSVKNISGVEYYRQDPPTDAVTTDAIFEGDSITEGSPTATAPFPYQISLLLSTNYYRYQQIVSFDASRPIRIRNVAEAGQTLAQMVTDATNQVDYYYDAALSKTAVFFLGGSNNLNTVATAGDIETAIHDYGTARRLIGFKFYVGTILPRTDVSGAAETKRLAVNTWLRANWATFADGLIDYAAIAQMSDPANLTYYADGVHPSDTGYGLMAALAAPYIAATIEARTSAAITIYNVPTSIATAGYITVPAITGESLAPNDELVFRWNKPTHTTDPDTGEIVVQPLSTALLDSGTQKDYQLFYRDDNDVLTDWEGRRIPINYQLLPDSNVPVVI